MFLSVSALSYSICCLMYTIVAGLLVVTQAQHRYKAILLAACSLMAVWSAAVALQQFDIIAPELSAPLAIVLEQLRTAGWIAVMAFILFVAYQKVIEPRLAVAFVVVLIGCMAFVIWQSSFGALPIFGVSGTQAKAFAAIIVATCGLALLENLFRNTGREARWALKYFCFAMAGIFGFDLILYARFALFGQFNEDMHAARGIVDALMAPLIVVAAARSKKWPIDLHVSRRIVFHTATILVAGVYLLGMSAIGYYLRILDSQWGVVARISFAAIAVLVLATALTSSAVQARIKNFVNRNFFSYRYDYRHEWLEFIDAVSGNLAQSSIPERIVRALANLLDCTAGAAWLHVEEDGVYRQAASWNIDGLAINIPVHEPLPTLLAATQGIVDVRQRRIDNVAFSDQRLPTWLTDHPRVWLVVPLIHSTGLRGFVVLGRPRAERDLNWEDFELLKTAGRQAASYIAEDQAATSLVKARRFEDFNRQFAFVVHDIKNLAGQMSLILKNSERHGHDPRFQKDVLATVADSLARMQSLLAQLKEKRSANTPIGRLDLSALLSRMAESWRLQIPGFQLNVLAGPVDVVADPQRLETIFSHLVQNAAEAAGATGQVGIKMTTSNVAPTGAVSSASGWVTVEVVDNGPGMDQTFIDQKLFQPLTSTKTTGLGIGAYQVLCMVREMGGALDVKSRLGEGTQMIVRLPLAMSVNALPNTDAAQPQI